MRCPYCDYQESKVIDSRPTDEGKSIRRRRECLRCGKRFTSYETVETVPLVVIKKDGSRQQFNRNKLIEGLIRACEKRPISAAEIDKITADIETELSNSLDREVTTLKIGELCMKKLKDIDQVAYVRFASVYRQFGDINMFMEELKGLLQEK